MTDVANQTAEPMLQFFGYKHLPANLAEVSELFHDLSQEIVAGLPRNPERTVALRKLLEAKDCAVRSLIYKTVAIGLLLLALACPALAEAPTVGHVNKIATLVALTRCDRAPRRWKFLKMVPGTVNRWTYLWILEDGSSVNKVEESPVKGVPDERQLPDKHPNLYVVYMIASGFGSAISSGVVSAIK